MLLTSFLLNLWHRNWLLYGMRVAKTNDTPEQENKVQQADYHNDANDCFLRNGEAFAFDNRKQSEACKKQNAKYGKNRMEQQFKHSVFRLSPFPFIFTQSPYFRLKTQRQPHYVMQTIAKAENEVNSIPS